MCCVHGVFRLVTSAFLLCSVFVVELVAEDNAKIIKAELALRKEVDALRLASQEKIEKLKAAYLKTISRSLTKAKDNQEERVRLEVKLEMIQAEDPVGDLMNELMPDEVFVDLAMPKSQMRVGYFAAERVEPDKAIALLLAQMKTLDPRYYDSVLGRAVNLGSPEAASLIIDYAQWNAMRWVDALSVSLLKWRDSEEKHDGIPLRVFYGVVLARWVDFQDDLSSDVKSQYLRDAASLLKDHTNVHPIILQQYIALEKHVQTDDPAAFAALRLKAIEGLKNLAEKEKGYEKIGALLSLVDCYEQQRDYAAARPYCEQAAELGSAVAQFRSGMHYLDQRWAPADKGLAIRLLSAAVAQGHRGARDVFHQRNLIDREKSLFDMTIDNGRNGGDEEFWRCSYSSYKGVFERRYVTFKDRWTVNIPREHYAPLHAAMSAFYAKNNGESTNEGKGQRYGLSLRTDLGKLPERKFLSCKKAPEPIAVILTDVERMKRSLPQYPLVENGVGELVSFESRWTIKQDEEIQGYMRRKALNVNYFNVGQVTTKMFGGAASTGLHGDSMPMSREDREGLYRAAQRVVRLPFVMDVDRERPYFYVSLKPSTELTHVLSYRCSLADPEQVPLEVKMFIKYSEYLQKKYK